MLYNKRRHRDRFEAFNRADRQDDGYEGAVRDMENVGEIKEYEMTGRYPWYKRFLQSLRKKNKRTKIRRTPKPTLTIDPTEHIRLKERP